MADKISKINANQIKDFISKNKKTKGEESRRPKKEKGAETGGEAGFKFMNEDPTTKEFNVIDVTTGKTKKMKFSKGGKVKLALRGGGRAYGKNS